MRAVIPNLRSLDTVSTCVQSRVTSCLRSLPLRTAIKERALDRVCIGPTLGAVPACLPSPVAMGGSRRPRSNQHLSTVRDGSLKNEQSALKAWKKDVTGLHSTLSHTMLFFGCLLVGCQDFNLLGFLRSLQYVGYKFKCLEGQNLQRSRS